MSYERETSRPQDDEPCGEGEVMLIVVTDIDKNNRRICVNTDHVIMVEPEMGALIYLEGGMRVKTRESWVEVVRMMGVEV